MKIKIYKFTIILLILFAGCSKSTLDEYTPSIITGDQVFKNLDGFEAALNGLYSTVRWERTEAMVGQPWELFQVGTDVMQTTANGLGVSLTWGAANNSTNGNIGAVFNWLYQLINSANTIIARAENPAVTWTGNGKTADVNKNRVIAEAKAIRAWAYRHLTYCWGDVPLSLKESTGSTIRTDWERTPVAQVRAQMRSDLLFAEQYVTVEPSFRGRLTKGAVQTYLAELYLALNKPDSAIIFADRVINEPAYKLITARYGVNKTKPGTSFSDMFLDGNSNREEGNTEGLWIYQYEYGLSGNVSNTLRRYMSSRYDLKGVKGKLAPFASVIPFKITVARGGRARGYVAITKFAIDLYENQDDRGSNYSIRKYLILSDGATNSIGAPAPIAADILPSGYAYGDTIKFDWSAEPIVPDAATARYFWPWSRKFEGNSPTDVQSGESFNDQIKTRSAEAYLIKAEAQINKGDNPGAATTLNILRARAKATPITAAQVNINFLLDERGRELLFEEDRRYVLLRTHKWLQRVQLYNKNNGALAVARDTIWPIPKAVIDANLTKTMPQNPGY